MLPESQKDEARWRSECPKGEEGGRMCGVFYHRTLADAKGRDERHEHDLDIENVES